jgi:hypoxanthine phosphoribosyltransferase
MGSFPDASLVVSESEVDQAYRQLAARLQPLISTEECVLVGVLMGGMIPTARLAGILTGDFLLDCCQVSRYRGGVKGGTLEWILTPKAVLEGKTVVLVDDIYDEGITLDYVVSALLERGASRVVSVVLIRKRHDRAKGRISPDFVGLEVDDHYVFGCGMDYQHRWRHLPAIYALKDE